MLPLISFIVSFFNVPLPMLLECIDSLMGVALRPSEREVIVVDDASPQSAAAEVEQRYGTAVSYVRLPRNGGLSHARNHGLQLAHGKYIQFVDADDTLLNEGYDKVLLTLREACSDGGGGEVAAAPDVVTFHFTHYADQSATRPFKKDAPISGAKLMATRNLRAAACCFVFRREAAGTLRFVEGVLHEDEYFTPLLFVHARSVVHTNAVAYHYRLRAQSITNTPDAAHLDRRFADMLDAVAYIVRHARESTAPLERQALLRRAHQLSMDIIYQLLKNPNSKARQRDVLHRLRSLGTYPFPLKGYTAKYVCFALLANTRAGLSMLQLAIRFLEK